MRLSQLRRQGTEAVLLRWEDGHEGPVTLSLLRDSCPCAECAGESVLFERYTPPQPDRNSPGRYTLVGAEPVGSYAIRFRWGDGHNLGLYPWEHLRRLCSCDSCAGGGAGKGEGHG